MGVTTGVVAQVGRVPGPRRPDDGAADEDATRYLCTAAHMDERFGRALIRNLLVREDRQPAAARGVDLVTVARHAVAARTRRLYRDGAIAAVVVVATGLGGWPVPWVLVWLSAMVLAVRALSVPPRGEDAPPRPGPSAGGSVGTRSGAPSASASGSGGASGPRTGAVLAGLRRGAGAQATLFLLAVFGGLMVILALSHADPFGLRETLHIPAPANTGDRLRRLGAPLAAAFGCWAAVFAEELAARSAVAERLAPGRFTPSRWLSAEPAWAQRAMGVLGARLAAAEAVRPPLAAPAEPFLGAGRQALRRRWLIELGPAASRSAPFDTEDLLDRACEALSEGLGPLDPGGPALVLVDDFPVAAGPALATRGDGDLPVRLLPMPAATSRGHSSARRFRRVRISRGAAGLTVTVFVGATAGNGLLQVELYGYVLAPVAGRFRIADRLTPWGWESVGACAARAARRTPGRILSAPGALARTVADPLLRRHYGAVAQRAAQHGTELDAGARFDPRARVCADPGEDFFADEDANLYLAVVERRVRAELRHLLPAEQADF
ncbi:hypothetical protein KDL01_12085 [Actinospica durhamensis]|uniref:Uncharacterized protein n=1 Tax=Actinospica durhamensis TaxID=1508375 RepID=A0A941ERY5_9ACTN|nr:hypothetical protein [Actinospica durhamensis]MBR7834009.1 hypothetical protein [Actinospica durhamensis]